LNNNRGAKVAAVMPQVLNMRGRRGVVPPGALTLAVIIKRPTRPHVIIIIARPPRTLGANNPRLGSAKKEGRSAVQ
jgi:hypothetical protein